jgi:GDPmannose 4,6-dehydratase
MWLILQQTKPDDYVLATGEQHSVREFVELAFAHVGKRIEWRGQGVDEQGVETSTDRVLVKIDSRYFRPTEVQTLHGDPTKAEQKLGWRHTIPFSALVREMMEADLAAISDGQSAERSIDATAFTPQQLRRYA